MEPSAGGALRVPQSKQAPPYSRKALQIKPGDRLEYVVEGDHATIRVHPGTRSLKGVLASKKGKKMSFGEIREAAVKYDAQPRPDVLRPTLC